MPAKSPAWRAGAFVRSVLPAEPAHWLILVGSTLLFISTSLRWWSGPLPAAANSYSWRVRAVWVPILFRVAGAISYYLCLVPRRKAGQGLFYAVFVAAGGTLLAMGTLGVSWLAGTMSVIDTTARSAYWWRLHTLKLLTTDFSVGFWAPTLGLLLVAIFCAMYCTGRASLPIRLPGTSHGAEVDQEFHRRTMRFVWVMIALIPLASLTSAVPFTLVHQLFASLLSDSRGGYLTWVSAISFVLCLFVLMLLAMRPDATKCLREGLRPPPARDAGISILIPVTIAAIWPLLTYVYDRTHWAAFEFQMHDAPQFAKHFVFPFWLGLWALIPALVEEIAWRGFLQPRFVRRYGIARGVLLLGVVWGAFHFSGDFGYRMNAVAILIALVRRLYLTVAQSYTLAWLAIRSRSILPAALAHGFYNIFLRIPVSTPLSIMPALWAVCGWVLFRYFPVDETRQEVAAGSGTTLQAAT